MMQNKLEMIRRYAKEKLGADRSGHDFYHVERVAKIASKLAEQEGVKDPLIIAAASYLHDVIDDKVVTDVAAETLELCSFLREMGLSDNEIKEIFYIIENLSYSKEIEAGKAHLSLAGQLVQDADRIDALGAIGILRTAYYGGHTQSPLYDPKIAPKNFTTKQAYREKSTVINHFYEKLFKLPETMNTAAGKEEAEKRKVFMEEFLKRFYEEWEQ